MFPFKEEEKFGKNKRKKRSAKDRLFSTAGLKRRVKNEQLIEVFEEEEDDDDDDEMEGPTTGVKPSEDDLRYSILLESSN